MSSARAPASNAAVTVTSSGTSSETDAGATDSVTTRDARSSSDRVSVAGSTVRPLARPPTVIVSAPSAIASFCGRSVNVVCPVVSLAGIVMASVDTKA